MNPDIRQPFERCNVCSEQCSVSRGAGAHMAGFPWVPTLCLHSDTKLLKPGTPHVLLLLTGCMGFLFYSCEAILILLTPISKERSLKINCIHPHFTILLRHIHSGRRTLQMALHYHFTGLYIPPKVRDRRNFMGDEK